jgi:tetratricopeptide (TPR) repeat protein
MTGVASKRAPNTRLAAVMAEAKISNKALAVRIAAEAKRINYEASPDHVSVARWLAGVKPHEETIRCIAAALSAKLGRPVSPADIGFDNVAGAAVAEPETDVVEASADYPAEAGQAVELLAELTDADLADKPPLATSAWSSSSAPRVITGYLFGAPPQLEIATGPFGGSGLEVAQRIRSTIRYFMDLDFQYGGGHVRKMLLFYWKTEIVNELRQAHMGPARREVFAAAADAAEVLAWSAYDAGRHGIAQRYFYQGLRLAREADDYLMGGQILSNLSHQANYLGKYTDAIQFARAAQSATFGKSSPTVDAMFYAMEARALASLGDERGCVEALHKAEQALDQGNPGEDPEWISYFDALELAGEAAHCFRDLGKPQEARRFVEHAIDQVRTPPRTRAFIGMVNAASALTAGDLDEAVSIATESIKLDSSLKSERYFRYLSDFSDSLQASHAGHPLVRAFTDQVRTVHTTLWVPPSARTGANPSTVRPEASAFEPDTRPQRSAIQQRSA